MKFAFYALTDFQLFNILKFVMADCEKSKGNGDLFLGDNLKEVHRKKEAILDLGLFAHVYIVHTLQYSENKLNRKMYSMLWSVNSGLFGRLLSKNEDKLIEKVKYDIVVVACAALQFQVFWNYYRPEQIYLIEDGTGSYSGDINRATFNSLRRFLSKIVGYEPRFTKLFVNSVEFCRSEMDLKIQEIPQPDAEQFSMAALRVFQDDHFHDTYHEGDMIYLQQPPGGYTAETLKKEEETIELLGKCMGKRLILRRHPSMKSQKKTGFRYDEDYDMWELIAARRLSEKNVLIGDYSTAQMTPKLLFNKEPYVVFLFKIYKPDYFPRLEQTYLEFKKLYKNDWRVIAPENLDELKAFLEKNIIYTGSREV